MGMIFNSADTLKLLEKLNGEFNSTVYVAKKPRHLSRIEQALNNLSNDHLYKVSSDLGIDLDVPSTASSKNRWELYLNQLETVFHSSLGIEYKEVILTVLKAYLKEPRCQAIEFYAVESTKYDLSYAPIPPKDPFYGYILIQSLDVGQTTAYFRATLSLPPKGTRKRAESPGVRVPAARRKPPEG